MSGSGFYDGVKVGRVVFREALKSLDVLAKSSKSPIWTKAISQSQTVKILRYATGSFPLVGPAIALGLDWCVRQYQDDLTSAVQTITTRKDKLLRSWSNFEETLEKAASPSEHYRPHSARGFRGEGEGWVPTTARAQALMDLRTKYDQIAREALEYEEALGVLVRAAEVAKADYAVWHDAVHSINAGPMRREYDSLVRELQR